MALNRLSLCMAMALPAMAAAQQAVGTLPAVQVQSEVASDTTEGSGQYSTAGKSSTATPLGLALRDTPQSVSVVTQQRIEDQGLATITDVVNNATGVSVNQYETHRAQFTARGFDINTLMIDGVPTSWEQAWSSGEAMTSLAIYDRVEVVRGATGLTTGAGDPSAAINLVRKRAHSKEFTGQAELELGSWSQRRAMVDLSTPLNQAKTVRGRVVAEASSKDSHIDLLHDDSKTLFATVEADLTARTQLRAGLSRQDNDTRGAMWGGLPVWFADGSRAEWDRSKTTSADWVRWDSVTDTAFAALEHQFDNGWKLGATYNRSKRKADSRLLYLLGAPDRSSGLGMFTWPGSYKVATTQDDLGLQASGPFEWLGRRHELALGFTHSKQKFNADSRAASGGLAPDFNNWDGSYPEPTWAPLSYYGDHTVTQNAVYGAVRLHVAEPLRVIAGARLTRYERSGDDAFSAPFSMKFSHEVTPYLGMVYDLSDAVSAYASYTSIFQPQQERDIHGNYLDPIEGKSFELGAKGEFMDGRLHASAAVFHIKQQNLAQSTGQNIPGTVPPETAYRAADGAKSRGFELELSGELARGWNMTASYTQFKATDADGADVNSIYPRRLLKLFTTYRLPGAWNQLTLGGGVTWQGKTHTDALTPLGAPERIQQNAYALVGLMARYDLSRQLSLQLNVNNVTDKSYYGMFAAFSQFTYGAPRNATVALRYKF
ncbi:TonB-dependent siderophore receptor [Oryzisolibacter sp. LB2S]|uniref:TonB-dependent siderophore receptor n=1 Tax=Alicycliphilus soli TaxID=3228789 RepID=UPI0034593F60